MRYKPTVVLPKVTDPHAVRKAVAEYDALASERSYETHGFKPAREYYLLIVGRRYDLKAILVTGWSCSATELPARLINRTLSFYALSDAFNDLRRPRKLMADRAPRSEIEAAFSSFCVHLWRV
jgi:hypothetical protein